MSNGQTMLIAFDGSPRAARALEHAARLLRPTTVEILTAWEPVARQAARTVSRTGVHQTVLDAEAAAEDPAQAEALKLCRRGVEVAQSLGLAGRAHLVEASTTIASAIVDAARELDVDVIVTGTRALSGFRAWWNSSTADQIVRASGLPVFIVPPELEEDEEEEPEYFEES
ncbi:universal stress protein [Corynebacterium lizhenjunii]|uniref:Universal stress protein n=1 Tax=Corynebacterium lizhenjunii TaxID=2709394 RepID=A0A7T0KES7_9CORY|nr:universal stress protein [Corynebacterium lizhenjunii]QPK78986.1 universal stress protein [Corynebacterium lizhenjunii]